MTSHYTFCADARDHGVRLDKFLAAHLRSLSRTRAASLINGGHVRIGGIPSLNVSFKVKQGCSIEITLPPVVDALPAPQDIPLDIIYEDQDLIVVNKPAGMVVHPAPGNQQGTLVNALLNHCGTSLSGINGVKRPGIVHRLDKDTSGLLVAAKTDQAHRHLTLQLSKRAMHRLYHAIVWGRPPPLEGTIEGAMGRDPRQRQRMAIRKDGRFARTHYKVLETFGTLASLVECCLDTGRTHQIRVHLSSRGHPLLGDRIYGKPFRALPHSLKGYLEEVWIKGRQALHAKELSFYHPLTEELLQFSVPLPQDMADLLRKMESLSPTSNF